jgi:hypothetical protein
MRRPQKHPTNDVVVKAKVAFDKCELPSAIRPATEVMPIEEAHRPAAANGDPNPNYYFAAAGLPTSLCRTTYSE